MFLIWWGGFSYLDIESMTTRERLLFCDLLAQEIKEHGNIKYGIPKQRM